MNTKRIMALVMTVIIIMSVNDLMIGMLANAWSGDVYEISPKLEYLGAPLTDGMSISETAQLTARYEFEAASYDVYRIAMPEPFAAVQADGIDVTTRGSDGNYHVIGEAIVTEANEILVTIFNFANEGGDATLDPDSDTDQDVTEEDRPEQEAAPESFTVSFELPCIFDLTKIPSEPGVVSRSVTLVSGGQVITVNLLAEARNPARIALFSNTFESVATITGMELTRGNDAAISDGALVSFYDQLKLWYTFSLTSAQSITIKDSMTDGAVTYEIPIPTRLAWPQNVGVTNLMAGTEKFAEIWAASGVAYIKFTGNFWIDPSEITNASLYMQCTLDKSAIGNDAESCTINLIDGNSVNILIAENQASEHTLTKLGTYADSRFNWTATYTPGTKAAEYPLTLEDFFNNTKHIFVPGSLKINGVSVDDNTFVKTIGTTTSISYEISEENKYQTVNFTYQTRLADSELKAETPANTTALNSLSLQDDNNANVVNPVNASVEVGAEHKRWMGKTGVQSGRYITWTVEINTLDRDLTDLVMYDAVPEWLEPPTPASVTVTAKGGGAAPAYTFSSAVDDQSDGSTFCVKFTDPPYDPQGYTVTYTTKIKDAYFDNPTSQREANRAWLTYNWRDYNSSGGVGPGAYTYYNRTPPTVDTGFTGDTNVIRKEAVGYNRSTHEITWKVTVNPYGVNIASGKITDDLTNLGQTYVSGSCVPGGTLSVDSTTTVNKLVINVGALGTTETTYTFKTLVTNPADYAANQSGKRYDNEVAFNGNLAVNNNSITDSASAWITVASQMLTKASKGYNYNTGEITWELIVNQNEMPMDNPVIVDTLPVGVRYVEGSISTGSAVQSGQTLTITLPDNTGNQVTVTYKTKVDPDEIGAFRSQDTVTLANSAVLSHTGYSGLASGTALQTISNKFLNKSGVYNDGVITFTVDINVNGITIPTGTVLTDQLTSGLRLDVTSVELWNATVAALGTLSKTTDKYKFDTKIGGNLVFNYDELMSANKFSFPLPNDDGRYILTYDCFVTGAGPYDNTVSLSGGNITGAPSSDHCVVSVGAGGGGTSSKSAKLIVEKVDSRRTGVKLAGVTFELYQRFAGNVIPDMKVAEATTDANGRVEFYPLSLNTTYVLKEVNAKAGYDKDTLNVINVPANVSVSKIDGKNDELVITVSTRGDYNLTATNRPASTDDNTESGGIRFTKQSDKAEKDNFIAWVDSADKAKFRITDKNYTSFYMEAEADENGVVTFKDVPFGTYTVSEVKTPAYHKTAASFDVTVNIDGTTSGNYGLSSPTMEYVNNVYFRPSLTIQKQNVGGGAALSGIAFGLYQADGTTFIESKSTDASGKLTFSTLLYGGSSYVVKELTQLNGYYTSGVYTISNVNTAGPIAVSWSNYAYAASLAVTKTDSLRSGVKLEGAEFAVYKSQTDASQDQNRIGTKTTNASGEAVFTGLALTQNTASLSIASEPSLISTSYWIKEITAPEGYTFNSTPIEVVLDPSGKTTPRTYKYTTSVSNTPKTGELKFTKYSKKDNDPIVPLAGAGFTIIDRTSGSSFTMTETSGADGVVKFTNVPFGTYLVRETTIPANHTAYDDFIVTIDKTGKVTEFDSQSNSTGLTGLIVINVVKTTSLEIEKVNGSGSVQGISFRLYREMSAGTWQQVELKTTGADGKVIFGNLLVGEQYKIVETAPDGYYQPQDYIFTAELSGHSFKWTNYLLDGKITVTKTDAMSGMPLMGVRYGLYASAAPLVLIKSAFTDASGVAVFDNLPLNYDYSMDVAGKYTITRADKSYLIRELDTIDGYVKDTSDHQVTLTPTVKDESVALANQPVKASIIFSKVNGWDIPLRDAEFTITGEQLNNGYQYTDTAVSGVDGQVTFANVPFGIYNIAEIAAPADHYLNPQVFTVEIGKNGGFIQPMPIKVVNEFNSFSVTVTKTNCDNNTPIEGVVYEIYDSSGVKRGTAATNNNGVVVFAGLMVNEDYEIRETTPVGYYPSAPTRVNATTTSQTIDWNGYPGEGEITLTVTDKDNGKPLSGVEYGIYDENDNLIGKAVSDTSGRLTFTGLPLSTTAIATYISPPSYDPDSDTTYTIREIQNISGYNTMDDDISITIQNDDPAADKLVSKTPTPQGGGTGSGGGVTGGGSGSSGNRNGSRGNSGSGGNGSGSGNNGGGRTAIETVRTLTEAILSAIGMEQTESTPVVDMSQLRTALADNGSDGDNNGLYDDFLISNATGRELGESNENSVETPNSNKEFSNGNESPDNGTEVNSSNADDPKDFVTLDNIPKLPTVSENNVLHPARIPAGYSAVLLRDNIYIIYDEDGMPLGYFVLPDGVDLDEYDIMNNLIPFGKPNPKTGDRFGKNFSLYASLITLLMAVGNMFIIRRKKN